MLRFYSEAKTQGADALKQLLNNVAGAVCVLTLVGAALWLLYSHFVVPLINDSPLPYKRLFLIGTALVPIKIAHSLLSNLLQADQQSGTLAKISVSEKLFRLIGLIAIVLTIGLSSERALILIIISELLFLTVIFYQTRHYLTHVSPKLQFATLAPLVAYGAPAMMGELTAVLLETGDRYVIQAYLGGEPLGQYAAAVNICMYLEWVLILALQSAIVPHYVKLYEESGREKTIEFLNGAFNLYIAVAVGVFAVFCVAAPQLVLFLAGEKYRDGLIVIPWFAAGYMLVGAICIAAAGVFIDKRTVLLVKWTVIAFVINMALNLFAIPRYGLIAAAIATFIAMCVRSIGVYYDASKTLPVAIPWQTLGQALICAMPAYYLGSLVETKITIFNLFFGSAIAGIVYVLLMLSLNATLRVWVFDRLHRLRLK